MCKISKPGTIISCCSCCPTAPVAPVTPVVHGMSIGGTDRERQRGMCREEGSCGHLLGCLY